MVTSADPAIYISPRKRIRYTKKEGGRKDCLEMLTRKHFMLYNILLSDRID